EFLHALSNGMVSFMSLMGVCESHLAMQILTKALAAYGVKGNAEAFLKAKEKNDVAGMLEAGLNIALDIITLFSSCFDGDTPVATETGFKRIDEIRAGDRVWSYNIETGERALKAVKEVFVRENDELLHIETSRGVVDATTSHPFYVVGKGWVAAGDLSVGDSIHAISGDAGIVTGLRLEKLDKPIPVYNLEVEDFHSYFVGSGVLVHNRCVVKENDVKIEYYPGDHDPLHFHVYGKGRMSKIDISGNPLKGYNLTAQQRKVVKKHLDDLLKFIAGQ
ncbi:polymorphic toxin-type HINT domain-containing protein, partial [Fretibacterium sp. OH1220_COT-178]|uniref:polymorphic toxin-type HINT domain-containing protein n=1 Tax=Fretibacterium sp. OH1220_COT-178 TaxID=2491047 RepID=UPI000F95780C